jgi:tetratricopeptide (TPR) repeat protein
MIACGLLLAGLTATVFAAGQKSREEPIFNSPTDPGQGGAGSQPAMTQEQQEQFSEYIVNGFAAEGRDDYATALEAYGKALELNKQSVTVWIRHAYVAAKLGKYDVTAQDLKQGTSCTPVSVTDYLTLSWFRATSPFPEMRDGTQAVAYAFKALREQESDAAYDMLAAGYAQMGNWAKAQENIRIAIKLYPDSGRMKMLQDHLELYKNRKPWREVWGQDQKEMGKAMQNAIN